jgi:hypothetical protein
MMALLQKMTVGSQDYEDEESMDDEHVHGHPDAACEECGSETCECDGPESGEQGKEKLTDGSLDDEYYDPGEDTDQPDEDDKYDDIYEEDDEEKINEDSSYPTINGKPVNIKSIKIEGGTVDDTADTHVTYAEFTDDTPLSKDELDELSKDSYLMSDLKMNMYEEINEWANDANNQRSEDDSYYEDIDFMTKVISGGLNNEKKDQTTLPHTKVKVDDPINEWKKLSGIK